jgi:hypothetical protein
LALFPVFDVTDRYQADLTSRALVLFVVVFMVRLGVHSVVLFVFVPVLTGLVVAFPVTIIKG